MTAGHALAVAGAGLVAGAVNAVAGGGSLLSFPTLVAVGYAPVTANVTNTIGLVPGYAGGSFGYRRELEGQWTLARQLALAAVLGSAAGVVALLVSPASVFEAIIPWLVAGASLVLLFKGRLTRLVANHHRPAGAPPGALLHATAVVGGAYGAYFGGALGVLLLAALGLLLEEGFQRVNALKGVLSLIINVVAALGFAVFAHVAWGAAAILAVASVAGGWAGAHLARRLPADRLRVAVALAGLGVAAYLYLR